MENERLSEMYAQIGGEIYAARTAAGYTRHELAKIAGTKANYISSIEKGSTAFAITTLLKIADALDLFIEIRVGSMCDGETDADTDADMGSDMGSGMDNTAEMRKMRHIQDALVLTIAQLQGTIEMPERPNAIWAALPDQKPAIDASPADQDND